MYEKILVPIDGSVMATQGLREAIELAKQLHSRIRLIHVVNESPWVVPGFPAAPPVDDLVLALRGAGESILARAKQAVATAGVDVDERLIQVIGERVGELVVAEAISWPADLIVCGTHGRRGVRRMLMGSDAEYIVRLTPVPVLLVRTPEPAVPAAT
ncbi:MAG: universal stress protein [Steroidobacteraceae bacterium]